MAHGGRVLLPDGGRVLLPDRGRKTQDRGLRSVKRGSALGVPQGN